MARNLDRGQVSTVEAVREVRGLVDDMGDLRNRVNGLSIDLSPEELF